MKKHYLIILCLFLSFLCGCSGTPRFHVNPQWKEAPSSFTVLFSEPYVQNQDDVADDLPEYAANFSDWFGQELAIEFEKQSGIKPAVLLQKDEHFSIVPLPLDSSVASRVPIPIVDSLPNVKGIVICIHPIQVWRRDDRCMGGTSCLPDHYLLFSSTYTIVSMEEQRVLAYGVLGVSSSFKFAMTKGDWEDDMNALVEQILEKTPLKK